MRKTVSISGTYSEMVKLANAIDEYAKTHMSLSCAGFFRMAGKECPDELVDYGWSNVKRELNDGYFYVYTGKLSENDEWHIECPKAVRL